VHNIHAHVLLYSEYNRLLQISSATFLPNIIKIGQHLT